MIDHDGHLQLKTTINKSFTVMSCGSLKGEPIVYWARSPQNEVDFHNANGEFLTRFSLTSFLVRVDSALFDVSGLFIQIFPLNGY